MKKDVQIELLGDRTGLEGLNPNITSPELLVNSTFGSGVWNSTGYTDADNYATGWDLNCNLWSSAARQFEWNASGWLQKTTFGAASRFRQDMTLGAGVAYTATIKFKNWTGSGICALISHGMAAPGQPVSVGANVVFFDPSASPAYGLGQGVGANPNNNVGFGGGCPGNAPGRDTGPNAGVWAEHTVVWRQANNASVHALTFQMDGNSTVTIDWIKLSRVDMNQSLLIGTLDGANPDDSPLSLTYAINSATNIEARAGAYSKTFQIPATANNNQVLKRMNITNSTHNDSALRFQTPCRISVNGLFAIEGLFKVQDVIRIKDKAVSYSCVFFGDNLGWSTLLENRLLNEIEYPNATNLKVCARDIIATWAADDATQVTEYDGTVSANTSPIVYPFATYGPTNETGGLTADKSMQLLREYWEAHTPTVPNTKTGCYFYGTSHLYDTTPLPVVDWRPMLWIYPMYHAIFNNIGYRVVSNFLESSEFKRLLYATPNASYQNPDERFQEYSNMSDFNSSAALTNTNILISVNTGQSLSHTWTTVPANHIATGSFTYSTDIDWSDAARFNNYLANSTTTTHTGTYSYITIGEAGYYSLELSNLCWGFSGATWSGTGGSNAIWNFGPGVGWQVKSVGNSSWDNVIIEQNTSYAYTNFVKWEGQYGQNFITSVPDSEFTGYFNKGDKLRLFCKVNWRLDGDSPSQGNTTTISGNTWRIYASEYDSIVGPKIASNGEIKVTLINPSRLEYAQTYDLTNVIPKEHKQLEFVKGIAHAFNLQFQTDEKTKTVFIEPFSEFYQPPRTALDWTAKLDRSKEVVDSWIDSDFTRRLIFKYKTDDKDAMIEELAISHFDGVEDYEPYIEYLNEAYPVGDTVFENPFFSGTYDVMKFATGGITTSSNNFYSAALWTTLGGTTAKGFDFSPRILMYEKKDYGIQNLTDMDANYVNWNTGRNWHGQWWEDSDTDSYWNSWVGWADTTVGASFPPAPFYGANPPYLPFGYNWSHAFLPQCTFINRWEFTNQFGLSYGNYSCQDYEYDGTLNGGTGGQSYGAQGIGLGLYHRYYKVMVDNLIQQPKLREAYIDLKTTDILNLDFSLPIYIDGIYYKLIKIVDYQPHFNTSTKVELHQYNPEQGAGIPQSPIFISPGSPAGGTYNPDGSAPMPTGPLPY